MTSKVTILNEQNVKKLQFYSTKYLINYLTTKTIIKYWMPLQAIDQAYCPWKNIEIDTTIHMNEYIQYYELVTSGQFVLLKVEGLLNFTCSGFFTEFKTLMSFAGFNSIKMLFCVRFISDLYTRDPFESAILTSETTSAAIDAVLTLGA